VSSRLHWGWLGAALGESLSSTRRVVSITGAVLGEVPGLSRAGEALGSVLGGDWSSDTGRTAGEAGTIIGRARGVALGIALGLALARHLDALGWHWGLHSGQHWRSTGSCLLEVLGSTGRDHWKRWAQHWATLVHHWALARNFTWVLVLPWRHTGYSTGRCDRLPGRLLLGMTLGDALGPLLGDEPRFIRRH
jgi:hypothetical protein